MNPRAGKIARWTAGTTLALGVHAAGAAVLLAHWQHEPDAVASAPAILIELAPLAAAPVAPANDAAPGPRQPQAEERPEAAEKPANDARIEPEAEKPPQQKLDLPAEPAPAASLTALPPPKPSQKQAEKKKARQKHASLASAPRTIEQKADRAAAPSPGALSRHADAVPNWRSSLVARLERYKRYPDGTNDIGVAQLAFNVDRAGGVHNARVIHSSGSAVLDRAAVDLAQRAAPMPPPPPEIAGAQIPIIVPIRYNAR